MLAGLSSSEVSFLGLEVCLHMFSLYLRALNTSFCKDASHWTRIHPFELHFNFITSLKALFPNMLTFRGAGGQDFNTGT